MKNSSPNLFFQKKEKGFTPSRKSQSDQFRKYFKCLLVIQSFYTVMILIELHDTNMIQQVLPVLENRYKFHTCTSSVLCTVVKHSLCRTCKKTRNPEFLFCSMAGKYKQDTLHQFLLYCNGICGRTCWHSPVFEFPFYTLSFNRRKTDHSYWFQYVIRFYTVNWYILYIMLHRYILTWLVA